MISNKTMCALNLFLSLFCITGCLHNSQTELLKRAIGRSEEIEIRRQLYAIPDKGHDYLIEALADEELSDRVARAGSQSNSFHIISYNFSRYYFVNVVNGKETILTDLNDKLHKRLETDETYLFCFMGVIGPKGGYLKGYLDELLDENSIPSSRKIAHTYLTENLGMKLDYNPLLPLANIPAQILEELKKVKNNNYEIIDSPIFDDFEKRHYFLTNPPALNITEKDVPAPLEIPYQNEDARIKYIEFYKSAYLRSANSNGNITFSCCISGDIPNRDAMIKGHYAGLLDGLEAKCNAVKSKYKIKD